MSTCNQGASYLSQVHGTCTCVADNTYMCSDGAKMYDAGSQANTDDLIRAQDRSRTGVAAAATTWAPWIIGGLVLGGGVWFLMRD